MEIEEQKKDSDTPENAQSPKETETVRKEPKVEEPKVEEPENVSDNSGDDFKQALLELRTIATEVKSLIKLVLESEEKPLKSDEQQTFTDDEINETEKFLGV